MFNPNQSAWEATRIEVWSLAALLAPVGYALSAIVLIAAVLMAIDVVRWGDALPSLEHGEVALPGGAMRWIWLALIVLSFAMGPSWVLRSHATSSGPPGLRVAVGGPITYQATELSPESTERFSYSLSLPAYRMGRLSGETRDGRRFEASTEAIVLPGGFLLVALAYWFFVIRHDRSSPGVEFLIEEATE